MILALLLVAVQPVLQTPAGLDLKLGGFVGERLRANLDNWELRVPAANPAMVQMFYDRDRLPDRRLLPWSGEFIGKYLCSSILSYRLLHDPRQKPNIDRLVNALIDSQGADGYLGAFDHHDRLTGSNWDMWNHYWAIRALLLYDEEFHSVTAMRAATRAADLIVETFLNRGLRMTNDGSFGQMNYAVIHAFTLLYRRTSNPRYLEMANWIVREWDLDGAGQYMKMALAGRDMFEFPGNRWESLHDFLGMYEMHLITGEPKYREAFSRIWASILKGDRHNTGGFTSGERTTGNPYDTGAIETCCTVAWIDMSVAMLKLTGDSRVADEIELSTLNGNLGGQSPSGSWWTYNTPMDGTREASAHTINFQCRPGSPELNCCSVNGPRGAALIWDWALLQSADGYALNYYGPSTLKAGTLTIEQQTDYPAGGNIALRLSLPKPAKFNLKLRIPSWSAKTRVSVNGKDIAAFAGTYLELPREWKTGDRIDLRLDMSLHYWGGEKQMAGLASVYHGPLLLAFDPAYNTMDAPSMPELDAREMVYEPETVKRPIQPLVLLKFGAVRLCDFATAGAYGNAYRTWLPVRNIEPVAYDPKHAVWASRPGASNASPDMLAMHRRSVTRLFAPAEASARALAGGGRYWIAGSHAGWVSEATSRAGGVYAATALKSPDLVRSGDVVWLSYSPATYERDLAAARELEGKGCVVVAFGPKPASGPPPVKHFIDSFTPWGASANVTVLGNTLSLWELTAELGAAAAREGKSLVFWQSVGVPGGTERYQRYKEEVFHKPGEPHIRPYAAGALSRAYIDYVEHMFATLDERESGHLRQVVSEIKSRSTLPVLMVIGHLMPHSLVGEGKWFRSVATEKEIPPVLGPDGYFLYLGYYSPIPATLWDMVHHSGAKAAWLVVPRPEQKLDFAAHGDILIDQRWPIGDACVEVRDYDIKILPASGVAQLYLYNWLERELTKPTGAALR